MQRTQSGMTVIGFLIIVVIAASVITLGVKMIPSYMDYFMYKDLFDRVADTPDIRGKSVSQIETMIDKRMQTNQLSLNKDDMFVGVDNGMLILEFSYKVEKHIGGNVDVVMSFDYTREIE